MNALITFMCVTVIASAVTAFTWTKPVFKTCEQSSFCRRCRNVKHNNSPYELVPDTWKTSSEWISVDLINKNNGHLFLLKVEGVKGDIFRVTIDEKTPLRKRYRVTDSLDGPVQTDAIEVVKLKTEVVITCGKNTAVVHTSPFKIDFYRNDVLFVEVNAKGLFKFEHYRKKPKKGEKSKDDVDNQPGAWEENFHSFHDSKPNGPEAVALDFTFPEAAVLIGLPEHTDSVALNSTVGGEPYRLYNVDVPFYELNTRVAMYGSVPVIYGHGVNGTAGVFWNNAAETWVDIYNRNSKKNDSSSKVTGCNREPLASHFMSESGIVDAFILLGETPLNTFKQYSNLTGVAPLPQQAALAYHQCRLSYMNESDVFSVSEKFDEYDIPMDTMWLDIDHADNYKYFFWNQKTFAHPLEMIKNLTNQGCHLTIINDPHIARSKSYYVHNGMTKYGYYTKYANGSVFEGECFPGPSSWPDLFNPHSRRYLADQYLLKNFNTTTNDVWIWNDVNEPSIFNGPESTFPRDVVHKTEMGTFENRVVHNLYGLMHVKSTFDGMYRRGNGKYRPFVLTRSHFAGSQRYAAIWTGDNTADWSYLAAFTKMCLSEAVGGISFCGADVGGFFNEPSTELVERWYQAGAFATFFRAHSNSNTKRREPWLYPNSTQQIIRDAIRKRYTFLPLWYVLFYEHERFGLPVMRPLLAQYPHDPEAFAIDNEYLLGDKLLVHPVTQAGATKVDVYFPRNSANGDGDLWYDIDDFELYDSIGYISVPVNSHKMPVYQRGGTIVPKKERVRRASTLMKNDPYTLVVCLDRSQEANGTLYTDDEQSYEYRNGKYIYAQLEFKNDVLINRFVDPCATPKKSASVEQVLIAGLNQVPQSAILITSSQVVELNVCEDGNAVIIDKKDGSFISIAEEFVIKFNF